jgi:Family of unknown function (DUF6062)
MQNSRDYQRLLEACTQEGCPLCRLTQENVQRYLDAWKYELFTDISIREELRRSQGFCHIHTWQLVSMGANLQLAQAYRDILSDTAEQLQGDGSSTASSLHKSWRHRRREPKQERTPCPACLQRDQALERLLPELRQALLDQTFYTRFAASSGLCLEHFRIACDGRNTTGEWLPLLRAAQLACLQRLDEQLGELIRKHDYHFKDEAHGSEMLSWKRAAGIVAGEDERIHS